MPAQLSILSYVEVASGCSCGTVIEVGNDPAAALHL